MLGCDSSSPLTGRPAFRVLYDSFWGVAKVYDQMDASNSGSRIDYWQTGAHGAAHDFEVIGYMEF